MYTVLFKSLETLEIILTVSYAHQGCIYLIKSRLH